MRRKHGHADIVRACRAFEPFVIDELNQLIDAGFHRRHPGTTIEPNLDTSQPSHKPGVKEWLQLPDELFLQFATGRFKIEPKRVIQGESMLCWAAALESWPDVTRSPKLSLKELRQKNARSPAGALDQTRIADFNRILAPLHISWEQKSRRKLTYSYFYNLLAKRSYLLLTYQISADVSHTVIVYGLGIPGDGISILSVMDPGASRGFV